jgi:conjugative relaxase-like TrwC/TraI family protein
VTASLKTLGVGRDAGLYYTNDPNREARPKSRDEYYVQDGGGVWWSTGETIVRDGAAIDAASFRDLCAGINPADGSSLVRGAGDKHRAGWDLTFSAPKSVSVLWAAGDQDQRAALEAAHRAAVAEALAFVRDEKLLCVRLGAGGTERQDPTDIIVGRFDHFTSRAGDPNIHTHCVILNVAGSADGKHRTLEPDELFGWQKVAGAAYRAGLSERLHEMGFKVREAGRDQIELQGVPDAVIEQFSKRSHQIEAEAGRDASGAQKEMAALATRSAKEELPVGDALESIWRKELNDLGVDAWSLAREAQPTKDHAPEIDDFAKLNPPEIQGQGVVARAASALFKHENVLSRKALIERGLIETGLSGDGIERVYREISALEASGDLVRLDGVDRGEAWTTPAIAASEAELTRAVSRHDERDWFSRASVENALSAAELSDEQEQAVKLATGRDGVVVIEAGAGTGKTTLTRAVVAAAEDSKLRVIGLAPSWAAADELLKSTGVDAMAIGAWRHRADRDPHRFDANSVVLVDEAGMIGTKDMAAIVTEARNAGAKVILLGDRQQLESVSGGGALRAVVEVLERTATLGTVRRQQVDWQRVASERMCAGDVEGGVRLYAREGQVELLSGPDKAQARVIEAWTAFRAEHGNNEAMIITRRNVDVVELNKLARAALRGEGELWGEDVSLHARDRKGKIQELPLAVGERVRFGEKLPAHGIRNGTRAVIQAIKPGRGGATVTFKLDDGRMISDDWSNLSVPGPSGAKRTPRIAHAYAGTIYSAQGRTVASTVTYVAAATEARELYVGMTRHRSDARVIVERERLEAKVKQRQADPRAPATSAAIYSAFFSEANRYQEKRNVADYVDDRETFARTGIVQTPAPTRGLSVLNEVRTVRSLGREAHWRDRALSRQLQRTLTAPSKALNRITSVLRGVRKFVRSAEQERTIEIER